MKRPPYNPGISPWRFLSPVLIPYFLIRALVDLLKRLIKKPPLGG